MAYFLRKMAKLCHFGLREPPPREWNGGSENGESALDSMPLTISSSPSIRSRIGVEDQGADPFTGSASAPNVVISSAFDETRAKFVPNLCCKTITDCPDFGAGFRPP